MPKRAEKLIVIEFFHRRDWLIHMSWLVGSTTVAQNKKWLFYNFGMHSNRDRLIGLTHAQELTHGVNLIGCASQKIACRSVPFDMSRLMGSTQFYKYYFLSKYTSKNYKIFSNRSQIFCSCSWDFRIRTW